MWNNFVSNRNSSFISQILVENRKKNGKQNFIIIVIGEQKHMYPLGHTHAQVFSNKRRALRKCVCVCVCLRKCALVWIWMLTHCNFTTSISKTRIGSWEFAARKKKRKRHGRRQRRDGKEGGDFRVSDWNGYAFSRLSLQGTIWVSNYSLSSSSSSSLPLFLNLKYRSCFLFRISMQLLDVRGCSSIARERPGIGGVCFGCA